MEAGRYSVAWPVTAGLCGIAFFIRVVEDVVTGDSTALDRLLLQRAHLLAISSDGNWLTPAARGIGALGNWQGLIALGLLLLWLGRRGVLPARTFAFYAAACAGSGVLILTFKFLVARPRPQIVPALDTAPFASFPSGHSLYALVAYGFVAWLVVRSRRAPLWLKGVAVLAAMAIAGLVGASRVYLAAHYPTDVAAGLLLGVPWLLAVLHMYERFEPRGEVVAVPAARTPSGRELPG